MNTGQKINPYCLHKVADLKKKIDKKI